MKFRLTYEIVTEKSAQYGDCMYRGFVTRYGGMPRKYGYLPKRPHEFTLRQAVTFLLTGSGHVDADRCPISAARPPRWFTRYGERDEWGESTSISMHLPEGISRYSAMRIARHVGCYGARRDELGMR